MNQKRLSFIFVTVFSLATLADASQTQKLQDKTDILLRAEDSNKTKIATFDKEKKFHIWDAKSGTLVRSLDEVISIPLNARSLTFSSTGDLEIDYSEPNSKNKFTVAKHLLNAKK
ncbi:hypothetical protein H0X06_04505 [Candidatus Dependentiae bacterium]|nr:hypothetical protein [Candidatus Dependentiae bacterium]